MGHREEINAHTAQAFNILMDSDEVPIEHLPPLQMPPSLYASRQRPDLCEEERHILGRPMYDVIPVVSVADESGSSEAKSAPL